MDAKIPPANFKWSTHFSSASRAKLNDWSALTCPNRRRRLQQHPLKLPNLPQLQQLQRRPTIVNKVAQLLPSSGHGVHRPARSVGHSLARSTCLDNTKFHLKLSRNSVEFTVTFSASLWVRRRASSSTVSSSSQRCSSLKGHILAVDPISSVTTFYSEAIEIIVSSKFCCKLLLFYSFFVENYF